MFAKGQNVKHCYTAKLRKFRVAAGHFEIFPVSQKIGKRQQFPLPVLGLDVAAVVG
jgi:hypothetical protein